MGNSCLKPAKCAHASTGNFVEGRGQCNKTAEDTGLSKQKRGSGGQGTSLENSKLERSISSDIKPFSFADLKNASKNFRSEIGEGGFGFVYKGWMDKNTMTPAKPGTGVLVAIKILKTESFQGHQEWLAEVNYLGTLRHPNIVKLIGYCAESDKRLLVYEFMSKGSLESHLFRKSSQHIPWVTRMQIATSVARGLAFLHSLNANVIYRDLKSSNILLDSDFNAKLSDFGLARDGPTGDKTHVSTRVIGTQGYAAPEYVATGHLAPRSDVYSFGVVLLELLSGRRALGDERASSPEETVVEWAQPFLVNNRRVLRIMDTRLGGQYSKKGAQTAAALAMQCLHVDPKFRPPMKDVVATLENLPSSKDIPRSPPANVNHRSPRQRIQPHSTSLVTK